MGKSIAGRSVAGVFATLFAVLMALAIAPAGAFADDLVAAGELTQQVAGWADIADDAVVFTVNVTAADGEENMDGKNDRSIDFTKAQMEALAKDNTETVYYQNIKGDSMHVFAVTKYVTADQLISAAKAAFAEGDFISADNSESPFPSGNRAFADCAGGKFFPKMTASNKDASDGMSAPAVIAIEYGEASGGDVAAGSLQEEAKGASAYKGLRNFWGRTEAEAKSGSLPGKPFVRDANVLNLTNTFKVFEQTADGTKTLKKAYTRDDLAKLAVSPASAEAAPGFLFNKNGWQVGSTTSYIPVATLLADANVQFSAGQKLVAAASDGFASYRTFEQVDAAKYFYPAASPTAVAAAGAEEVGTVLALNWSTAAVKTTAGAAKAAIFDDAKGLVKQTRLFCGLTAVDDENTGGNRFATGPVEITVMSPKDINDASITVSGIESLYKYTGSAIEPTVTVKDGGVTLKAATKKGGDYEVAFEDNIKAGTAKVTLTGVNSYAGTRTFTFKIVDTTKALSSKKVTADQIKELAALGVTNVTLGKNVKSIAAGAFKGTKVKTLTLSTTKLSKKGVKNALKKSNVKTVKIQVKKYKSTKGLKGKAKKKAQAYNKKAKAINKKYAKKYAAFFTKANCGANVIVKA